MVSAKVLADGHLARAALASSESLPENVNYAVKSSYLLKLTGIRAGSGGEVERSPDSREEI